MNPLETYFQELNYIRSSGGAVKETSYYPALSNLLNEVGKTLKPKVRCIINIRNAGAGLPDGGLYTAEQFQKVAKGELRNGQLPSRGCIEAKSTGEEVKDVARDQQVLRYVNRYRQVLVTNYRDFLLVGVDPDGKVTNRESFSLAPNEKEFWLASSHPRAMADKQGERFIEYLKRVMLHTAPIALPKDVAWFLASYARDAKMRLEDSDLPALATVRGALEEALGLKFEGEKGEHFFRSTLVQTLFYGVFSAWVLWSKKHPPIEKSARFNWHEAVWSLNVPMIKVLYEQVATRTKLEPLGLTEVLDWTEAVLNRVDRKAFFENFEELHAVQYFYEPFLQAFDPELRKELGVWYTPPEIVKYMVARVDTVLREEMEISDGLADPRVYVLDPCCGTGTYLVEVLHKIHEILKAKGEDALAADDLKRAAMDRVFGFEILPAPFVVSHLQLGLLLQNVGAPLNETQSEGDERVGVYLTNSLTGWELRDQPPLTWPELEQERTGSGVIKRDKPILVVLGNPPYNAFAGRSPKEEEGLVEDYKGIYFVDPPSKGKKRKGSKQRRVRRYRLGDPVSMGGWGVKKFNLDELYVRFFRLAERRIAEKTAKGVVCFISNFSYLGDHSFVIMRERFLSEFDSLWFDNMNGDSRETGKLTPEGNPDPSVFSTKYNREGIRKGTAIGLMTRKQKRDEHPVVRVREFWGTNKRADLVSSLEHEDFNSQYEEIQPTTETRFSFRPSDITAQYKEWPTILEFADKQLLQGMDEDRANALIDFEPERIRSRMRAFFEPTVGWQQFAALGTGLSRKSAAFDPEKIRRKAQKEDKFEITNIRRYLFRPFDIRWCYFTSVAGVWKRSRPELWQQYKRGNTFLLSRAAKVAEPEGIPVLFTRNLLSRDCMKGHAVAFPLCLYGSTKKTHPSQSDFFEGDHTEGTIGANLSPLARAYLASVDVKGADSEMEIGALIWMHVLAIAYTPTYLTENADGIRGDWPRIPLPSTKEALCQSAKLGRKISTLLDTETQVDGVTFGTIDSTLRTVSVISHATGGALKPTEDLKVSANWGHLNKKGATMPGKGKVIERDYNSTESAAIEESAGRLGLSTKDLFAHLGERTCDVYLNDVAFWRNIPARVWDYTIGGYQIIKKWLSYREHKLLGRSITADEARELMNIARRIASILLLEHALDANYQKIKGAPYEWPRDVMS